MNNFGEDVKTALKMKDVGLGMMKTRRMAGVLIEEIGYDELRSRIKKLEEIATKLDRQLNQPD